jgi:hypothetical protein
MDEETPREEYEAPELRELGTVAELTQFDGGSPTDSPGDA